MATSLLPVRSVVIGDLDGECACTCIELGKLITMNYVRKYEFYGFL